MFKNLFKRKKSRLVQHAEKEFHSKKDDKISEKLASFFMTGSVPVETYNTHSYVQMSELIKEHPDDTEDVELGLTRCENCDELAYDGRICHNCGAKDIGE